MTTRGRGLVGALVLAAGLVGGCGIGANTSPRPVPVASPRPAATVGGAVEQTRGAIANALAGLSVQFGPATRDHRPAESTRLRNAPRAVFQAILPDEPEAGFIVVYQFPDAAAAVDAGNEEAGYLGTGPAKVQYQRETRHVLRQLGPTLIVYSWSPTTARDPALAEAIATALGTLGIGFSVPR